MYSVDFLVVFSVDDNIVLSSGINHYIGGLQRAHHASSIPNI